MKNYSCVVIGKGLVGSATAKYLSLDESDVALIGPDEPKDWSEGEIFAAHYDEARVQRITGWDADWTLLNKMSVLAYPELQRRSGIAFHRPVGCLYVNPHGKDVYLEQAPALANRFALQADHELNDESLAHSFKDFRFPKGSYGMFEPGPAGYINPRNLLRAQLTQCMTHAVTIHPDIVASIRKIQGGYELTCRSGFVCTAKRLVMATGSFQNFTHLLQEPLTMRSKSEVVLLGRMETQEAERYALLPSLLYEIKTKDLEGIYLLPPVRYPDGHTYIKIGCNFPDDTWFHDLAGIRDWFRTGDSDRFLPGLKEALLAIMPDLHCDEYLTKRCVVSYTEEKRPYIDYYRDESIVIAGGCNGYSAMCSDAMGKVAAHRVQGKNPVEFAREAFRLSYALS
ncbi:MAG TPA: FAD-dependent oxidoreductase [Cyclobacteriaceae bacterium]|nr:FAD-dependent oxidoreductase [Cyclobacteriaceae bacterium]